MLELTVMLIGVVILIRGRIPVSRKKHLVGKPARILGVVCLVMPLVRLA